MSITPPSSTEISRVIGASITGREVLRISELSVVERVTLTERPNVTPRTAILIELRVMSYELRVGFNS